MASYKATYNSTDRIATHTLLACQKVQSLAYTPEHFPKIYLPQTTFGKCILYGSVIVITQARTRRKFR